MLPGFNPSSNQLGLIPSPKPKTLLLSMAKSRCQSKHLGLRPCQCVNVIRYLMFLFFHSQLLNYKKGNIEKMKGNWNLISVGNNAALMPVPTNMALIWWWTTLINFVFVRVLIVFLVNKGDIIIKTFPPINFEIQFSLYKTKEKREPLLFAENTEKIHLEFKASFNFIHFMKFNCHNHNQILNCIIAFSHTSDK